MHAGQLAHHDRRPDRVVDVAEQWVVVLVRRGVGAGRGHPPCQRAGLQRDVAQVADCVARRLRPAVLALLATLLGVDRDGLTVERVQRPVPLVEGVRHVLADVGLVEFVVPAVGENPGAPDQCRVASVDGGVLVQRRVEVGAGGQVVADALAVLVQSDVKAVADEEAAVAVVLGLVLVHPGQNVVPRLVLQPTVHRAAQPLTFQPGVVPVLEDRDRSGHVRQRGRAHHSAGHHEAGVGPLPAEDRIHLDRFGRQDDPRLVTRADVGREPAHGFVVQRRLRIVLVGQVDREQRVEVPRDGLQRLACLADVADQRGVGRHVGAPRRVEGIRRLVEVAAAADAADTRAHHQSGLRVLAAQDDLEAAEHRRLGPRRGDHTVFDGDADVEITLDAPQWADEEVELIGHARSPFCSSPSGLKRRTCLLWTTAAPRSGPPPPGPCT